LKPSFEPLVTLGLPFHNSWLWYQCVLYLIIFLTCI